ncbi:MAG: MFS transporter [Anaerolineaceae bacterium]|nr:MFS transporter [Anaerolineaceae bacterium]
MVQEQEAPIASGNQKWLAMAGIGMGVFMATLDSSIVNISLPTLVNELHTDFATITWVILSYVLVLTSLMLGAARLGDMFDKKKLYIIGLILFTISSFLCGIAPGVGWLIGFRALQGIGAAMTQALGAAIITQIFPAKERGRALGLIGTTVSTGIAIGPPIGGLLIGLVGWRAIFLVNIPVGILAVYVVSRVVPSLSTRPGQRFDGLGAAILFSTLACYAMGMTLWQQQGLAAPLPRVLLIAALAGMVFFIWLETRIQQPMIDLNLFRNVLFSLNLLMGFLVFIVMAGAFIMPFFLENVKGYAVQTVGLILMANPIAMGLVAPAAGALSDRYGSRGITLAGLGLITLSCLTISTLNENVSALGFIARYIPLGLGLGFFQSPNNSAIMGAAPRDRLGVASGLLSLARTLGQTTGLPLMGALFTTLALAKGGLPVGTDATTAPANAIVSGINGTYQIAAIIIFASLLLASTALWLDNRKKQEARVDFQKQP